MNGTSIIPIIIAALTGGALAAGITAWFNRGKTEAESDVFNAQAADIITKTATMLLEKSVAVANVNESRLETKISELEGRVDHLSVVVEALTRQLVGAGLTPDIPAMRTTTTTSSSVTLTETEES